MRAATIEAGEAVLRPPTWWAWCLPGLDKRAYLFVCALQAGTMNQQARAKQIQQMVNFMKLEARDKANEIRVKTDHDCVVEHQKLVFAAKKKLEAEFAKREKNLEVQKRVYVRVCEREPRASPQSHSTLDAGKSHKVSCKCG